jgi:NAD(P)-dependent dehydrogenase (short-subunit alcohol dehydrogenase family)
MDLGIKGRRAIVCGSSKGLGRGVAENLAEAGVTLTLNARTAERLEQTAKEISARYGVEVRTVAADVTVEAGRRRLLEAEPAPDILVTNAGGPPPGMWSDWDRDAWLGAIDANMLTPIFLMKSVLPGMIDRGWGRIVNITSATVKSPVEELGLSNAARCGLTGFVAGTARQVAKHGVVINIYCRGCTRPIVSLRCWAKQPAPEDYRRKRSETRPMAPIPRGVSEPPRNSARWPHSCAADMRAIWSARIFCSTAGRSGRRWGRGVPQASVICDHAVIASRRRSDPEAQQSPLDCFVASLLAVTSRTRRAQ